MYLLLRLVKEFYGIGRLKPSLLGVAPRRKMNLLPASPSLSHPPSVPCRPPARSNTVILILTNKPRRLGSRSWPGFVGSTFCHTLDLKGVGGCMMTGRWCSDRTLCGGGSQQTCKGVLQEFWLQRSGSMWDATRGARQGTGDETRHNDLWPTVVQSRLLSPGRFIRILVH